MSKPTNSKASSSQKLEYSKELIDANKVFVGGFKKNISKSELKSYFKRFGNVIKVNIIVDHSTGEQKGFAFIEFDNGSSVYNTFKEKGHVISGQKVVVRQARCREFVSPVVAGNPSIIALNADRIWPNLHQLSESYKNPSKNKSGESLGLKKPLLQHEERTLRWICKMEEAAAPPGGVLGFNNHATLSADNLSKMKTTIAFVFHKKDDAQKSNGDSLNGGTLIITPASDLAQWKSQFNSNLKLNSLSLLIFHGPSKEKAPQRIASHDLVITTYPTMQKQSDESPLYKINWKRVILDEGHVIQSHSTARSQSVFKLKRKYSWALTDSPIYSDASYSYSLLKFLKCEPFDDLDFWNEMIENEDPGIQSVFKNLVDEIVFDPEKVDIERKMGDLQIQAERKQKKSQGNEGTKEPSSASSEIKVKGEKTARSDKKVASKRS